ncbi:hypothetical protein SAMN05660653_02892 [Desulfonatronum thiosulfatophilum]|uniref:Uncharacterized protein n=1 Tax=Desulfonatronum thiosulfatophilum TaxID=617002 RepID=A0A1G6EJ72_9BACT|nr:hypothetical protein SAMN05660653_02892 [Desulfonatronum thiosulfatophilum]
MYPRHKQEKKQLRIEVFSDVEKGHQAEQGNYGVLFDFFVFEFSVFGLERLAL